MKKVSVIIPCFNATKYLPKCFMSLVQQTIGIDQIELIFVDDASTDEDATWNMLQENAITQVTAIIMGGATLIAYIIGEGLTDAANVENSATHLIETQNDEQ